MNVKRLIHVMVITVFLGCGASKRFEVKMEAMERANASLQVQQADLLRKVDELSNSLLVFQDQLETMKVSVERREEPSIRVVSHGKTVFKQQKKTRQESSKKGESFFGVGDASGDALPKLRLSNKDLAEFSRQQKPNKTALKANTFSEEVKRERTVDDPDAIAAYNKAYRKLEEENHTEAIRLLEEFVSRFPSHSYADNARYWIGESYFRIRDFENAARHFERVVKEYPNGNKVPDALLRAGVSYMKLSKPLQAQHVLEQVVALYPRSVAAQKAKETLLQVSTQGSAERRM